MSDGASNEPVIAPLPTPISVESRTASPAPPAEAAEIARQADEAKLPKGKDEPKASAAKVEEKAKPLSTRDALRAAAAKVNAEPVAEKASPIKADPVAKPAEPAPAAAAKDAKAAPESAKVAEPVRGEDGKFVSTKPAAEPVKDAPAAAKVAEPAPAAAKPAALPSHTAEPAPARFSAVAKEKWAEAPDEVRAEVTRAVTELTKGFEKHRASAERDAELTEFHEMATKGGTTVKEALSKYVGMENALRNPDTRDRGIEAIFANVGISPREWAAKILGQAPDVAASQQDATIRELRDHINRLEQGLGSIQQERVQAKTDSTTEAVTKFAADPAHSRFEELSEDIAFFLKTRTKDLAEAYKLAERLNPAPAKAAEPDPAPIAAVASSAAPVVTLVPSPVAASTAGQKSIAGAPTAGSDPVRKQPSTSIKEALRRAQQRAG